MLLRKLFLLCAILSCGRPSRPVTPTPNNEPSASDSSKEEITHQNPPEETVEHMEEDVSATKKPSPVENQASTTTTKEAPTNPPMDLPKTKYGWGGLTNKGNGKFRFISID